VSGGGSNFKAIHADILNGTINGDVTVVVTNAPSCAAAAYARSHGIPVVVYPKSKKTGQEGTPDATVCDSPQDLVDVLASHNVDLVVLAGYMKLIPVEVVKAFEKRMLNIHPGLLPGPFGGPGMYGMNVHTAVVNSGSRVSGCTVHFVNEVFDDGPILGQAVVPVYIGDSPERVAARVLKQEHELFPRCVRAFCDGRIGWRADGVPYIVENL
jgi:phosphoribosylglycinamide formyltransferase